MFSEEAVQGGMVLELRLKEEGEFELYRSSIGKVTERSMPLSERWLSKH